MVKKNTVVTINELDISHEEYPTWRYSVEVRANNKLIWDDLYYDKPTEKDVLESIEDLLEEVKNA